jgi:Cu(I)/Ag(I) efflux system membrane fusion protein
MKLKTIVVLAVMIAAAALIGAACSRSSGDSAPAGQKVAYYTCSMHPSVKSDKPGSCSICGMALTPVYTNAPATNAPAANP